MNIAHTSLSLFSTFKFPFAEDVSRVKYNFDQKPDSIMSRCIWLV